MSAFYWGCKVTLARFKRMVASVSYRSLFLQSNVMSYPCLTKNSLAKPNQTKTYLT